MAILNALGDRPMGWAIWLVALALAVHLVDRGQLLPQASSTPVGWQGFEMITLK